MAQSNGWATAFHSDGRVIHTQDIYKAFGAGTQDQFTVRFVRLVGTFVMDRTLYCGSPDVSVDATAAEFTGYWENRNEPHMFRFQNQDLDTILKWNGGYFQPDRRPDGVRDSIINAIYVGSVHCKALAFINLLQAEKCACGITAVQTGGTGSLMVVLTNCDIRNIFGDRTVDGQATGDHAHGIFTEGNVHLVRIGCTLNDIGWVRNNSIYPRVTFNQGLYHVGSRLDDLCNTTNSASQTAVVSCTGRSVLSGNHYGDNAIDEGHGHKNHPFKSHVETYGSDFTTGGPLKDIDGGRLMACVSIDAVKSSKIVGPTYNVIDGDAVWKDDWAAVGISRRTSGTESVEVHNFTIANRNIGVSTTAPLDNRFRFVNVDASGCKYPLRTGWEVSEERPIGGVFENCNFVSTVQEEA